MESLELRQGALALARLAALDVEIGQCQSTAGDIDRAVARLREQVDAASAGLASRQEVEAIDGGVQAAGDGALARERDRYRRLFEEHQDFSRVARSRSRVLQSELRVLELRRKRLEREVPPTILAAYASLVGAGRKPAVARLSEGLCGGCRALIGPEVHEALSRQSEPLRCPRCERFLLLASWVPA
jgi:predicted  nucleic acid-binding Zn-ribbon protein